MPSENVKFLYKSQEIFMKLFNEYSSIASKDKKKQFVEKELQVCQQKELLKKYITMQ